MTSGLPFDESPPVDCQLRSGSVRAALATALAGLHIEVAAGHRSAPIGDQILGAFEVRRPFLSDDETRRLPHHVELTVRLDFADEDGLGDMVVRHHRRITVDRKSVV